MKKIFFLILFLSLNGVFAECSISTTLPIITPSDSKISIEWKVRGACGDATNEFKVYYYKAGNWFPVTTFLAGVNQAKYLVNWDITNIADGEYKIRVLQSGESSTHVTSDSFFIDRTAPTVRDDVWILPSGGDIFKGKLLLKWNKESIYDSGKLASAPISLQYSLTGGSFVDIVKDIDNSGVYTWDTTGINGNNVYIRILAKDLFGNTGSGMSKGFVIDNTPPKPLTILKINNEAIKDINYCNFTPELIIGGTEQKEVGMKIFIYDIETDKNYLSSIESGGVVRLNPMNDGNYDLVAVAVDNAGNKSDISNVVKIMRDSFPPKAPSIKSAQIENGSLKVVVGNIEEKDKKDGELILMNGLNLMKGQSSTNSIFDYGVVGQDVYRLTVVHKDFAGNISDKSNEKVVVYDTRSPEGVNLNVPSSVLYGNIGVKASAIDNVGIRSFDLLVDGKILGISNAGDFDLNTTQYKNGNHKLKLVAYDFAGLTGESREYEVKIFNFKDNNHWANSYLRDLYNDGFITSNESNGTIDQEGVINRASALKLVMSFFGYKLSDRTDYNNIFNDVGSKSWYAPYVKTALEKSLISGFKAKHRITRVGRTYDEKNVYNLQFLLKGLGYNLEANGKFDGKTISAIGNYQKYNLLNVSGNLGLQTVALLNNEEIVRKGVEIEDKFIYFRPEANLNRVQALKLILDFSGVEIPSKGGIWYEKYVSFAKDKGIIVGNAKGDVMLEKQVTLGEMAKMLLKVQDVKKGIQ